MPSNKNVSLQLVAWSKYHYRVQNPFMYYHVLVTLQASHTCGLAITQSSVRMSVTELPWLGHTSCITQASQCRWTEVSSHQQTFWSASRTYSTIFRWSKNLSGYICKMETDEEYKKVQKSNLTRVEQIKELHEETEELKKNNEVGRITNEIIRCVGYYKRL